MHVRSAKKLRNQTIIYLGKLQYPMWELVLTQDVPFWKTRIFSRRNGPRMASLLVTRQDGEESLTWPKKQNKTQWATFNKIGLDKWLVDVIKWLKTLILEINLDWLQLMWQLRKDTKKLWMYWCNKNMSNKKKMLKIYLTNEKLVFMCMTNATRT